MKKIFLFCCISFLVAQKIWAQVSGTKSIPGDYSRISDAISDIMLNGMSGSVILELQSTYYWHNEFYPITIPENFPTSLNATLTIRPAAAATDVSVGTGFMGGGPMPTGNIPIFNIYGSYINIDGRPGGTGNSKQLTIWSQAAEGSAIQFTNNASNNTITHCNLLGINDQMYSGSLGAPRGIVTFNPEGPFPVGVLGGIHDNTIENCVFDGAIIWQPYYAVYAFGNNDAPNVRNKILNNEIRNFTFSGIEIRPDGPGSSWTISGNSFYSTLATYTYPQDAINIFHANNANGTNIIEGNYIGGNAAQAMGKWLGGPQFGIVCGSYAGGVSASIQNNVIKNMEFIEQDSDPLSSSYATFAGISITNNQGPNQIQCSGNLIGGGATDYGIRVNAPGHSKNAYFYGILYGNCSRGAVTQNTIQNIHMTSTLRSSFLGIKTEVLGGVTVSQNTIQQLDIQSAGNVVIVNILNDDENVIPCDPSLNVSPLFENNLITSINAISANGDASVTGINIDGRISSNTGNIIGSATQANSISATGTTASVTGILVNGNPENVSVSDDIIANLTAQGTVSASVNGIHFNGAGILKISGNQVHHLAASAIKGIYIQPTTGSSAVTVEKNTVTGANNNTGTGIETFVASGASLNITATNNTVSNWQTGILLAAASGTTLQQSFQNNSVVSNQTGFVNQNGTSVNATCNWWGDASGPSGAGSGTGNPVGPNVIFSPWATLSTYVAVNAGADQTITGSGSKTLTPTYTVCGTATYLWSTGATTPSITVSPTVTTAYTIKITDGSGHEATDEVIVFVQTVSPVKISMLNTVVIEGNSGTNTAIFILYLNKISPVPVTVQYTTGNITALAPQDYVQKSGIVTFPANSLAGVLQTITVQVKGDLLTELDETFKVTLSNAVNATINTATATCTIIDNDAPCLRINDTTATENSQQAIVRVILTSASSRTIKVKYDTKDGTAKAPADYTKVSNGTLTFLPGETTKNIAITIKKDGVNNEPTEKFQVTLKEADNANIATTSYCNARKEASVSILNSTGSQNRELLTNTQLNDKGEGPDVVVPGILQKHSQLIIQGVNGIDNELVIMDSKGTIVTQLPKYKNTWSPGNITTGIYFYQLRVRINEGGYKMYRGKIFITD